MTVYNNTLLRIMFAFGFFLLTGEKTHAQEKGCASVREGKFRVVTEGDPTTTITRTRDTQIEEVKELGGKYVFDVKWLDECTYTLQPRKVITGDASIMKKEIILTVRIRDINKSYYMADISSNVNEMKLSFKVEIIH